MKCLTIIAHTDDQQDLTNRLNIIKQVRGFSLSHIEGHGVESEQDAFLAARENIVGSMPRVRIDIVLQDGDVGTVLDALRGTVATGRIYYCVAPVEQDGHL